jgi:filamentous hemagglutinin family protein
MESASSRALSAGAIVGAMLLPAAVRGQTLLPQGGNVVSGQAAIGVQSANALTITQSSSRAVINWNSFSVGQNGSVNFSQPSSTAAILNRVTGSTSSTIAGQITGNGQVYLVNPNGIAITPGGSVQVGGGFVGSTLGIADGDFNAGRLVFNGNGASANVSNAGVISGARGGFVALIGGSVANSGTINVPLGKVGLGSGERATINPTGDGFLQVAIPTTATAPDGRALVDVAGNIRAAGGSISISAATAQQAVRDAVNLSGVLSARSISGRNGNIMLDGGAGGNVTVSGSLSASGGKRREGGTIAVTGGNVRLTSTARLDASGSTGGKILIGGDLRGGQDLSAKLVPQPVANAQTTIVEDGATLNARGANGAGGNVVVWSDAATGFNGTIIATGAGTGDGGTVEVSSHGLLGYGGLVDVRSSNGRTGTLLLDPFDVTISTAPDSNISLLSSVFSLLGNSSNISIASLTSALASANVTISTGASGSQQGNITVANAITLGSGNSLTLSAANDIAINASISSSSSGGLTLAAGRNVTINGDIVSSGAALNVNLNAASSGAGSIAVIGATIDTKGGNLIASATQTGAGSAITLNNATLNLGGGTATLTGAAIAGAGIRFSGTNSLVGGAGGSFTLTGTSTSGNGLQLDPGASLATSGDKTLSGASSSGRGFQFATGSSLTNSSGNLTLSGNSSSSLGLDLLSSSSIANAGSGILALNAVGGANFGGSISSASGALAISGSGNIAQSGGLIAASSLLLSGAGGNFNLNSSGNQIGTIAGTGTSIAVTDSAALVVGGVLGTSGVTTTGNISLATSGDLAIASGATINGASPILSAGGHFINNAGSAAVTAASGRWLIYSNDPASDIFGGLNSASTAIWNATTATLAPGSVAAVGNRYLFAFQPALTFASTSASKTYGTDASGAIAGNYTVSGFQAGVINAFLGDTAATAFSGAPLVSSSGAAASANVTGSPYAINVALGSLTSLANYLLIVQSNGGLTVNPALITVVPIGGSSTYGSSPSNPGLSVTGLVNGQTSAVLSGLSSTFGITSRTGIGSYVLNVTGSLTNPNYKLVGTNIAIWAVTQLRGSLTDNSSPSIAGVSISAGLSVSTSASGTNSHTLDGVGNSSGKINTGDGGGTNGPGPVPAGSPRSGNPPADTGDRARIAPDGPARGASAQPVVPSAGLSSGVSPTAPLAAIASAAAPPSSRLHAPAGCEGGGQGCSAPMQASKPRQPDSSFSKLNRSALSDALDRQIAELRNSETVKAAALVKFAAGASIAVTAGIVAWLLRSGALLGALLSSMPMWREFDPLLIALRPKRRDDEGQPASEADLIFDHAGRGLSSGQGVLS